MRRPRRVHPIMSTTPFQTTVNCWNGQEFCQVGPLVDPLIVRVGPHAGPQVDPLPVTCD